MINDTATKILDLITHNDTVLTAMNLNNRLDKRIQILINKQEQKKKN